MSVKASTSNDTDRARLAAIISRKARRSRGAVLVEYAFLLTAVAIPVLAGISAGGVQMLNQYRAARTSIMAPIP